MVLLGECEVFGHAGYADQVAGVSLDKLFGVVDGRAVVFEGEFDGFEFGVYEVDVGFYAFDVGGVAGDQAFALRAVGFLLSDKRVDGFDLLFEIIV